MNLIQQLEKEQFDKLSATKTIPEFGPGDTVIVNVKVVEGERTRVQAYEGVCIGRSGGGLNESFTVRKISYGEGVERVFPVMSPMIDSIKVVRRGKVRRAKLYYLRNLRGKSARIVEKKTERATASPSASNFSRNGMRRKRGVLPRAFFVVDTYLGISPANRLIVAAARPVLEIQNGSRSYQRRLRHRPARHHRRSLAAARPLLRTLRDFSDVRAYARSLMLRRRPLLARIRA